MLNVVRLTPLWGRPGGFPAPVSPCDREPGDYWGNPAVSLRRASGRDRHQWAAGGGAGWGQTRETCPPYKCGRSLALLLAEQAQGLAPANMNLALGIDDAAHVETGNMLKIAWIVGYQRNPVSERGCCNP